MLDSKMLRDNPEKIKQSLKNRGYDPSEIKVRKGV
jgi:broad-specificity NMP kinase